MNTEELYEQVDEILESYNIIYTADDIGELTLPDFFQTVLPISHLKRPRTAQLFLINLP